MAALLRLLFFEPFAAFTRRVDEFEEVWEPFLTDEPEVGDSLE